MTDVLIAPPVSPEQAQIGATGEMPSSDTHVEASTSVAIAEPTPAVNALGVPVDERGFPVPVTGPPLNQRNIRESSQGDETAFTTSQLEAMTPAEAAAHGFVPNPHAGPYNKMPPYVTPDHLDRLGDSRGSYSSSTR